MKHRNKEGNRTGKYFGVWSVIRRVENNRFGQSRWKCKCACGTIRVRTGAALKRHAVPKCRCNKFIDLTGRTFGRLLVIKALPSRLWKCRCECGEVSTHFTNELVRSKPVRSCGCLKHDTAPSKTHGLSGTLQYIMWYSAKVRAKHSQKPFTISIYDIVIPKCCPCCEVVLKTDHSSVADNSPSLDRMDTTCGYIKGNVWVICYSCNRMKNNATTPQQLRQIADAWEKQLKEITCQ